MRFLLILLPALLVACSSAAAQPTRTPGVIRLGVLCSDAESRLMDMNTELSNRRPSVIYAREATEAAALYDIIRACEGTDIFFSR